MGGDQWLGLLCTWGWSNGLFSRAIGQISTLQIVYILQIFDQINFVVGNRGSVVESDFHTKLKKLDVQEGKKDKLFADHGM